MLKTIKLDVVSKYRLSSAQTANTEDKIRSSWAHYQQAPYEW